MTVRERRDKQWYYRKWVRLPNGNRVRIFGVPGNWGLPNTKVAAMAACDKHTAMAITTGSAKPPKAAPPPKAGQTLESFAPTFIAASEAKNKFSSVASKRQILNSHIIPSLGSLPLESVTYAAIEDFKLSLLRKTAERPALSPKTINNVLTVLRRLLAVAAKRGLLEKVPEIEWLHAERPPFDFLTFDEADRLITASGDWHTMIVVAIRTGMRQGELLGLQWDDVDLVAGRLVVRRAIVKGRLTTPKNRKSREIPLAPSAIAALKAHRHLRGPFVFCGSDGKPLTSGECKHPLWRACKGAKLGRRIGWHALRHTFASHLVMRSVNLRTVQELMGHATMTMTLRYAHLAPEVTRDAVAMLDSGHPVPNGGANQRIKAESDGKRR